MSVQILTRVVAGEIDSLSDTAVDCSIYVGVTINYEDENDASIIKYCDREELLDFYSSSSVLNRQGIYTKQSPDDLNWEDNYVELAEATAEILTDDKDGWCSDLTWFYAELLYVTPSVLESAIELGLTLGKALSGNVESAAVLNGESVSAHLERYHDGLYTLLCYSYDNNSPEKVDYSHILHKAKMQESFVREVWGSITTNKEGEVKKIALVNYLQQDGTGLKQIQQSKDDADIFVVHGTNGDHYLVLTDEEADERYAEKVKQNVLRFDSDAFIAGSSLLEEDDESRQLVDSLRESDSVGVALRLIDDFDAFVKDTKIGAGRGPVLSADGEEHQGAIEYEGVEHTFYIYELN